ncbi:Pyocin large subunit-like protein [Pseudomonas simiae]|uniref:Pyocin large subunit-like protein n=1 Tax=Pseudomonas simiae TaxID=321846 RepID=A0ABS9G8Y2_9PSED|nr:Pyocin large subunit-like protein [Pseudomonas simiae]MCF5049326.1 Pyocin large subunit-like protein [Pseudomonas simiae]MCF5188065.1 Pyocin large subunit-like protein [Pseudomonas simiae]MCF5286945.1 Pyocin large subunit-like protein [Pseudomonas simiae]MCF5319991.1 Pyocin large subunit-like protein [Pseudomonas simiae]MCF5336885.1 Pyocin large subunit-like protein [Pseudomonas simiae]
MAGDWIKMRIDLQTHPKVFRMVSALKADRLRIIGGLHIAWSIFDTHSSDGELVGYTVEAMDAVVGWPGFTQAMIDVEWASVNDGGSLVMPRFDEHNGASAKRRANDSERKRNERKKPVRNLSASDADSLRTREEKRREEKKEQDQKQGAGAPAKAGKFDPLNAKPENVSDKAWADWCQHRKEIRKPLTAKSCEQQAKALVGHSAPDQVLATSISNGWTGIFPDKLSNNVHQFPQSRHTGFAERDYTAGLIQREDGSYAI